MIFPVKRLADLGFEISATSGTAGVLQRMGVPVSLVRRQSQGPGPDGEPTVVDRIAAGEYDIVVNTPHGVGARADGYEIRTASVTANVPCITTVQGLSAAVQGIEALLRADLEVRSLQDYAAAMRPDAVANGADGTLSHSAAVGAAS
ncbi:MAG: carbamoyl-phosphate synthase large subunit, partial [Actinomycetales bacterium]